MRVALVAHWDWVIYNFRLPLARHLQNCGIEVIFVCPFGKYVPKLCKSGFKWIRWKIDRRSINPLKELLAVWRLLHIYRSEQFDAVHHFTIKPNLYGSFVARMVKIPLVINTFTGLGSLFAENSLMALLRFFVLPLLRSALHRSNIVTIFQNKGDRDNFVQLRLIPKKQTRIIMSTGVNISIFHPCENGISDNFQPLVPICIMACRLIREKGIAEFVEAAKLLRNSDIQARFWLVGEPDLGNPSCISKKQLKAWKEEKIVEFLGHRLDIPQLLQQSHIAILSSFYGEGIPRFLLEAAAIGLPLVATKIEGCQLVVKEGINGFLVPPKNSQALANTIKKLLINEDLRKQYGKASRYIAVNQFDEQKILSQYEALYRSMGILL